MPVTRGRLVCEDEGAERLDGNRSVRRSV